MSARLVIFSLLIAGVVAQAQESAIATNMLSATNPPPPAVAATNAPLRVIRAELLRSLLQGTNDLVLVDVMPRLYYQDFHIKGAMSIPEPEIADTVRDWPRYRRIVVYCLDVDCDTSRDAARTLITMGFTDVLYESIGKGKLLD